MKVNRISPASHTNGSSTAPPTRAGPSRAGNDGQRSTLRAQLEETEFDVLVVGGGATGLGAALEAARRGLKTALVERGDFASGTSSKSTNMLHGGVRYLQAFLKDRTNQTAQMELVKKVGSFFKED